MASKRLTRKFTDVVAEVERQLKSHYEVTDAKLKAWRDKAKALDYKFPHSTMVNIEDLWIDYEVQRDVLHKHIINIMQKWDPRVCSPGSACRVNSKIYLYDAQHRSLAAAMLGYTEVPCAVVDTTDPNFASYAFELLNDTGVKRLNPSDLHRNALVRFKNGSPDIKNLRARTLQDQFDNNLIDLQDKGSRASDNLRGDHDYFFSHFKYAYKGIDLDDSGRVLSNILNAIKTVFPLQEEIDQGVFIGLYELQRITGTAGTVKLPNGWMVDVLKSAKKVFNSSHLVHSRAKVQWEHSHPGAGWNAPLAMSNFLRELHVLDGGKINLPFHGAASKTGIEDGNIAPGLFPQTTKGVNYVSA
jgi:hypothetical protein